MKTLALVALFSALAPFASNVEALSLHPLQALQRYAAVESTSQDANTISDLGSAMKYWISAFQKAMPCGNQNFPVLAPFTVVNQQLNFTSEYYSLKGSISALQVTGLNKFQILKLYYSNEYLNFDIYYPSIQILGEFNVSTRANMLGLWFNEQVAGLSNIKLNGLRFVGSYKLGPLSENPNNYLDMSDYKLQTLVENVEVNGWNDNYNVQVNNFRNEIFGKMIKMTVQETQGIVQNAIKEYYVPMVNEAYNTITMQQLIDYIMESALDMEQISC